MFAMKKIFTFSAIIALTALIMILTGCGGGGGSVNPPNPDNTVTLRISVLSLNLSGVPTPVTGAQVYLVSGTGSLASASTDTFRDNGDGTYSWIGSYLGYTGVLVIPPDGYYPQLAGYKAVGATVYSVYNQPVNDSRLPIAPYDDTQYAVIGLTPNGIDLGTARVYEQPGANPPPTPDFP